MTTVPTTIKGSRPSIAARLDRLPLSSLHYRLLFINGFGWLFDAMDVGIITFVVAALSKDWALNPQEIGLIGSAGLVGMFIGAAVAGPIADRLGRKTIFQVTLLAFAIGTLLCATAWNVTSMIIFRLVVGMGLGAELPVVSSLMSELVPSIHRGRFVVLLESFWAVGWLAASLVAFLLIPTYGWRASFLIGAAPALYVWVVRRRLPESPRWLESKGRLQEAEAIFKKMEAECHGAEVVQQIVSEDMFAHQEPQRLGFRALCTTPYKKRTVMLWILWFGMVFGYYGIFVWLPTLLVRAGFSIVSSFGYVVLITLAQIPGYFSAAFLVDRIGRKPVITIYLVFSAVCAVFFGASTKANEILIWASLMSFFNLGAWGGIYTYTPELYPTPIRATGAGSATAFGRLGGAIAPTVTGFLLLPLGRSGVLLLNASLLLVAALAVACLGTETKGRSLEQIS